jgi:outer membrane protein assembly factor BamA
MEPVKHALLGLILLLSLGSPVIAQDTRDAELEKRRRDKAASAQKDRRNTLERALFRLEDKLLLERLFNPHHGLFVRVGGLGEGAGFAAGPAFRLRNEHVVFTTTSAVTLRRYWIVDGTVDVPRLGSDRLSAQLYARRRDYPQEDFFGAGPDSRVEDQTDFRLKDTAVRGSLGVHLTPWLLAGGGVEYLAPDISAGTDSRFPDTVTAIDPRFAPGLVEQPDFLRYEGRLDLDYRDPVLNPRSGGRYLFTVSRYADRDLDRYSFTRADVDLQQFIPFFHAHRYLALRGLFTTTNTDSDNEVPFYLQPTLGGAYSLRGFRAYRFRDRHLMLLQAEYRYIVNAYVTGALFYDAGKVASDRSDLDFKDLERNYGFGFRFGSRQGVGFRSDIAFGSGEGTRILLRFDNVF